MTDFVVHRVEWSYMQLGNYCNYDSETLMMIIECTDFEGGMRKKEFSDPSFEAAYDLVRNDVDGYKGYKGYKGY